MDGTAGRLLLEARRRAGVSQTELARRTRTPQSVLSAYERSRRQPSVAALARLLAALGFGLGLTERGLDPVTAGRRLRELMDFAYDFPPRDPGPLTYPRLPDTGRQP